jgi:Flp pilus assembly secretin CpaC
MTISYHSRLGSILFTTACLVTFALLAGPVMRPLPSAQAGIEVRGALQSSSPSLGLSVTAGKSLLLDSPARIVRATVGKPDLAAATSIDDHELLINARNPGDTSVTLWAPDGSRKQLQLHVECAPDSTVARKNETAQRVVYHGVVASYENAMDRLETAITGASR